MTTLHLVWRVWAALKNKQTSVPISVKINLVTLLSISHKYFEEVQTAFTVLSTLSQSLLDSLLAENIRAGKNVMEDIFLVQISTAFLIRHIQIESCNLITSFLDMHLY